MSAKRSPSKRDIESTVMWLLTHKQDEVKSLLRKFRRLTPGKQQEMDKKLLYLASILDIAVKNGKKGVRCKSCGMPMHVKWFGCQNPIALVMRAAPGQPLSPGASAHPIAQRTPTERTPARRKKTKR